MSSQLRTAVRWTYDDFRQVLYSRTALLMVWTWVPSEVSADPPGSSVILVTTARVEPALLPSLEGYLWVCRSLRSVWMSTHSEEWVFRSPELAVGHAAPFWAAEFPLILRNEFPALQSSWLGSTLPSEWRSVFSFWGMSSPLLRALW